VLLGSHRLQPLTVVFAVLCLSIGLGDLRSSHAQSTPEQLLFGPKQYLRKTGPPNQYTDTFTVPASIGPPFLLHIVNGDANGSHRISSAWVTLNGVQIAGLNELGPNVAVLDGAVTLQPTSTLTVKVASSPGSYLTISVFGTPILGNLTQARVSHTATLLPNGKVFLAGGAGSDGLVLNSAELFDPVTLSATGLTGTLTSARTEHTVTLLPQTETLLIAGQDRFGPLFSTEMFNPSSQTFRVLSPNVQVLRSGHTATLLLDGRVVITGGQSAGALGWAEAFNPQTVVVFKPSYDPEAGTFTVLPNGLVTPRWDHTATLLPNGQILITGGRNDSDVLVSAELFDPATETFTALASAMTTPRAGHTATLLPDGLVLILGGQTAAGAVASAEVFSSSTNSFSAVTPGLTTARVNHTATLLPTGVVLIAGGQNSSGILASTEVYAPSPADTMAPLVNQVSPPSGATGVDLTEIIAVRFSEPVDVRTLTTTSVMLTGGGPVSAMLSPGEQGLMVFLVPSLPLAAGTTYTLSLTSDITDTSGHPLSVFISQFTAVAAPSITSFTPDSGTIGTAVTITGTNFDPVTSKNEVKFNGVLATVTATSATSLTALVPGGATTGPITVTTRGGTATSATNFTVITQPPPTISSFTPTSGKAGTNVTVTGQNFDPVPSNNQVKFNGASAAVISATGTTLIATVPPTATTGFVSMTTASGTAHSATSFGVISITTFSVTPTLATLPIGSSQQVRAIATFADQTTLDLTGFTAWGSSNSNVASATSGGLAQGVAQGTATITGLLGTLSGSASVQVIVNDSSGPLPPDPATVAPPLDQTVVTTMADATAFLYTGANPIQTGVALGTIQTTRAAVVRGVVRGRDGYPIPGVTITILNHPEFGQTLTRPDGMFDMAVNGGGLLTVKYEKTGLLPVQRQVNVPWQAFAVAADAIMIPLDTQVTTVTVNAATMQVAQGGVVTDAAGARRATLFVPAGTSATMTLPGGGTQPLSTLSMRLTEYTVGPNFKQSLPATLPPGDLNQYALELSVDEAVAAGATRVSFNQPVVLYVDNFLDFSCGDPLPIGSYDTVKAVWTPEPAGVVIQILSITGGLANVDTDGNGTADNTWLSTAERQQLAVQYAAGQKLWRIPTTHFSTTKSACNTTTPPGATPPNGGEPTQSDPQINDPDCQGGSVIACQNQTLGETLAITGTPFNLQYESNRVRGRTGANKISIPLSGGTVPASLKRIELTITQGGRSTVQTFPPTANQQTTFIGDGRDPYGRPVQGPRSTKVHVEFVYDGVHRITGMPKGREVSLAQDWELRSGGWEQQALGLGGWSLNVQHAYDPVTRTLHRGDGTTVQAEALSPIVTTVAGGGTPPDGLGDGGPATQANLITPHYMAVGPDGSLYIADQLHHRVRKVDPQGIITTVAGTGTAGFSGDDGLATAAQLNRPLGLALCPDGSLYISERDNVRIRRVDPQGIITTFAGTGTAGFSGDSGPATAAQFSAELRALAVGPDGTLYIADASNHRIRRIKTNGIIDTLAGTGIAGYAGDGGPAMQARLNIPWGIAVGPDGAVYVADTFNYAIRRIDTEGIITTVAGTPTVPGITGDGGPATQARLLEAIGVAVRSDGAIYIGGYNHHRVRWVDAETKIINTLAGTGQGILDAGFSGDGGPAAAAQMAWPAGMGFGQDGALYVTEPSYNLLGRVRRVAPPFSGFASSDLLVPSKDGSEVYVFSNLGRHLRTLDALTGAVKYQFAYDSSGLLASVTDVAGQVTTIERDGTGIATGIVVPGGQRTSFSMEGNGYLASLRNPAGETTHLTYSADGLLATLTDPRSGVHQFTYDAQGRLIKDQDPANGFKALARTEQSTGWTVALSTALNRTTAYQVENLATGDLRRKVTDPSGLLTTTLIKLDGTATVTAPDGTITTSIEGPDPRFGMQAPITKSLSVMLPTGLTSTLTTTRTATLANPNDPLSLTSQTDTLVINGRTYTSAFTQSTKQIVTTTPVGRTSAVTLDAQGRVVQEQVTGLEAVSYTYDAQGRLSTITQGTGTNVRTSTLSYDTKNQLTSILDPLSRTVGFSYDLAGRITTQTLPDSRVIGYAYDGNGNVTSITPPGKPAHAFAYTPVDLEADYTPPDLGFTPRDTQYTYNLDRKITLVTSPDGQTLSLGYDSGGRLSTLTLPGSQVMTYAYGATTGTLFSITAPNSTLSYAYDGSLLTNTTWAGTVAGSVSRAYDTNFRISSQSVNGANAISFGYDNDSLLTSAGSLTITRSVQNGLITGTTLGVATDTRTYSTFGELGQYTASVSGTPVLDVQYTRDKLGRITQKVETFGGSTDTFVYTYDTAGRLTEVNKNGATAGHYTYDSNGNRLSQTDAAGTVNGTYDAQDRLLSYGNLQLAYTANGELLTKSNPVLGQSASFTYDVLGNLASASLPGGTLVEYVVDGQNRRIGKKLNGTLVQGFLYQNQLNPAAELDGTAAVVSRFVYGTKANVPDYMIKAGITYRIVSDHLGSPRLVVNTAEGTVAQRIDYDEFGNITLDTNPGFQPFGFAGGLYDQHSGLTRFGVRDYDAQVGRWTAKDPILFKGDDTNLFGYVAENPIQTIDPMGLKPWYGNYCGPGNNAPQTAKNCIDRACQAHDECYDHCGFTAYSRWIPPGLWSACAARCDNQLILDVAACRNPSGCPAPATP